MSKFYAVKVGRNIGIYTSWAECEKNVKGFSGAVYKSFKTKREAEALVFDEFPLITEKNVGLFLDEFSPNLDQESREEFLANHFPSIKKEYNLIEIYTDGSHFKHIKDGYIGCGAFCKYMGKEYFFSCHVDAKLLQKYDIDPTTKISNCTAEFLAFSEIVYLLSKKDLTKYKFLFRNDYIGVENWFIGSWKTKESYIRKIYEKSKEYSKNLNISFKHIDGHSSNYENDQADKMAKSQIEFNTFNELIDSL